LENTVAVKSLLSNARETVRPRSVPRRAVLLPCLPVCHPFLPPPSPPPQPTPAASPPRRRRWKWRKWLSDLGRNDNKIPL
jgi:hypothetical protein